MKLMQYKEFFIQDNEQGIVLLMDGEAKVIDNFPNVLGAKMWVEINTNPDYAYLKNKDRAL